MTDEPVSLNERRAVREANASLWTPLEALKSLVRDIEAGVCNPKLVYVAMYSTEAQGLAGYDYLVAGGTGSNVEVCGLLAIHLAERTDNRD